jgi:hypothetical protein
MISTETPTGLPGNFSAIFCSASFAWQKMQNKK